MAISLSELQSQLSFRRRFWNPARERMDLWHLMLLLVDIAQWTKEEGAKRFIGSEPQATVMLARSILARNPLQPFIPMRDLEAADDIKNSQQVEKIIIGAFNDVDRVLVGRGMQSSRYIAAMHLLVRGWAVSHLILRDNFQEKGMLTPLDYEPWDMRFFLPHFDRRGYLDSCIYESFPTWGEVLADFPSLGVSGPKIDLMRSVTRLEWYDKEDYAVAIQAAPPSVYIPEPSRSKMVKLDWAQPPTPHGLDNIPVVCVAANGLPFNNMPLMAGVAPPIAIDYLNRFNTRNRRIPVWRGPTGYVAEWGRSILAAVEDLVPQFNEVVSLLLQILYNDAFGTWFTYTHAGDMTEIQSGGVHAMRVGEAAQRVAGISASADLYRSLAIVKESYQRGTFSDALFGLSAFEGSGFLQTQLRNAALNSLDPYMQAYKTWAEHVAQLLLSQMKQAKGITWEVWGRTNDLRHFRIEASSDAVDRMWPVEMKPAPALPDDLALRVDIAKRMLDPNMPLASYQTVLDRVLEFGDAQRERELMFDDMAERDPVVVFLRIQQRLMARGLDELAETFGQKAFATAFIQQMSQMMAMSKMQQAMQMGLSPGAGGAGGAEGLQGQPASAPEPGFAPENLPPEAAVGPTEGVGGAAGPVL